ncbi:MAG: hypothetical protein ACRBFS_03265 [Aureispira sp.]
MKIILSISLWVLILPLAFGQSPVKHEIGVDIGTGISGVLYPDRAQYTPDFAKVVEWSRGASASATLKYNALLLNERLNLGAGFGYQRKSYVEGRLWDTPSVPTNYSRLPIVSQMLILPLEVGYRLPLGGRHSLMADALFVPSYQLISAPARDFGEFTTGLIVPTVNRFNFEMGLKLGYRLQLSEKMSLQMSVMGTWEPLEREVWAYQELYNVQLVVGVRRQF